MQILKDVCQIFILRAALVGGSGSLELDQTDGHQKGPFSGPFVSVGTPSGDTSGNQAELLVVGGLLVVGEEYP